MCTRSGRVQEAAHHINTAMKGSDESLDMLKLQNSLQNCPKDFLIQPGRKLVHKVRARPCTCLC